MQLTDFSYELPSELIAQSPLPDRSASRLLVQNGAKLEHRQFSDLPGLLRRGDHLVFNNTRVIRARLFGHKASGGRVELLIERVLGVNEVLTKIRASKSPKAGTVLQFGFADAVVQGRQDDLFHVQFELPDGMGVDQLLEEHGQLPLPPYIDRAPDTRDDDRYQTVYASAPGAVAAPTAGLHFDRALFDALAAQDISHSFVTLHVGAGTFMPVRTSNIADHVMHAERVTVDGDTVRQVRRVKERGGRIIAVGTTCVRSLEAASQSGTLEDFRGETDLFLTPGSRFHTVDAMITNFHLPESTLLMLVSAFGGLQHTRAAYAEAIAERYRFFSYGDAMLVWPAIDD